MNDTAPVNACMKHICNISSPEVGIEPGQYRLRCRKKNKHKVCVDTVYTMCYT